MENNLLVELDAAEFTFLAALMQADTVLGLADPFGGLLGQEIEQLWAQAQQTLLEKNYIALDSEQRVVMDTTVAALVSVCCYPAVTFALSFEPVQGDPLLSYFHLYKDLVVEQFVQTGTYQLRDIGSYDQLVPRLLELCKLERQQYLESQANLGNLQGTGGLLAIVAESAAWQVTGFGFLVGDQGLGLLWPTNRKGEEIVEFQACSFHQLVGELNNLVCRQVDVEVSGQVGGA